MTPEQIAVLGKDRRGTEELGQRAGGHGALLSHCHGRAEGAVLQYHLRWGLLQVLVPLWLPLWHELLCLEISSTAEVRRNFGVP